MQWRALLNLVFNCIEAPLQPKWQPFFADLVTALAAQLQSPARVQGVRLICTVLVGGFSNDTFVMNHTHSDLGLSV